MPREIQLCVRLKSLRERRAIAEWASMCSETTNEFVVAAVRERIRSLSDSRPDFAKIVNQKIYGGIHGNGPQEDQEVGEEVD